MKTNDLVNGGILYRKATEEDLHQVALIHKESFGGSFISSLGIGLIKKFYYEYLIEDCPFVIAVSDDGIIGFSMGYYNGSRGTERFIKNNRLHLVFRCFLRMILLDKQVIFRVKNYIKACIYIRKNTSSSTISELSADLLSICVIDKYKGKGVSMELITYFESLLKDKGAHHFTLSVLKKNERALNFYKKVGMKICFENESKYIMIKQI